MPSTLLVALGGALGSVARFWMTILIGRMTGPNFPWGTIVINVLGSMIIGGFAALPTMIGNRWSISSDTRIFLMVGLCGGFTTFSSFSLQTVELIREGRLLAALANVLVSVLVCCIATSIGYAGVSGMLGTQVTFARNP